MANEMYYTENQIKMQEQIKREFAAKSFVNWETVGIAYRIEPGRVIVTPTGCFTVTDNSGEYVKLAKDGKEYNFKKFDVYVPIGKGVGKVEYR